jgi:virulence factor
MVEKIKVALVGAGGMANGVHYPSLAEFEDVELVGLCDLVEEKLHATADKFGIERRYSDYKKMIEETAPQAIYILMPPHQLFDLVIHSLDAKLHVFIEKPPGITLDQIRHMAHRAEQNGCLTMVGFNRRYAPVLRQARQKVFDHAGSPHQVVSTFYKWHNPPAPYYNGAVDILTSDAIHAVDTMRWMAASDIKRISAVVRRHGQPLELSWNALCLFENDCVGVLLTNWQTGGRTHQFEMHGNGISVFCNPDVESVIHLNGALRAEVTSTQDAAGATEMFKYYGFYGASRHFIDSIRMNREPDSCFPDAVKTMELVDRIAHTPL